MCFNMLVALVESVAIFGENVKKIPAYLFCNAKNICSFVFTGNPPTVGSSAFSDNYAYALYPVHNSEWTKSARAGLRFPSHLDRLLHGAGFLRGLPR